MDITYSAETGLKESNEVSVHLSAAFIVSVGWVCISAAGKLYHCWHYCPLSRHLAEIFHLWRQNNNNFSNILLVLANVHFIIWYILSLWSCESYNFYNGWNTDNLSSIYHQTHSAWRLSLRIHDVRYYSWSNWPCRHIVCHQWWVPI